MRLCFPVMSHPPRNMYLSVTATLPERRAAGRLVLSNAVCFPCSKLTKMTIGDVTGVVLRPEIRLIFDPTGRAKRAIERRGQIRSAKRLLAQCIQDACDGLFLGVNGRILAADIGDDLR